MKENETEKGVGLRKKVKKERTKQLILLSLAVALLAVVALLAASCSQGKFTSEPHLANLQQLTFGGDNAEAYFSFDGST